MYKQPAVAAVGEPFRKSFENELHDRDIAVCNFSADDEQVRCSGRADKMHTIVGDDRSTVSNAVFEAQKDVDFRHRIVTRVHSHTSTDAARCKEQNKASLTKKYN